MALTALLFVFTLAQLFLANAGADASPWIAALHAVNALVVVGFAHVIATRARRSRYAPADAPEPAP